jgi:hypothetical protein
MKTPVATVLLLMISAVLCSSAVDDENAIHWDSRLHQYTIAKATSLMPGFLQRQILKHKREILRGCIDVLKELPANSELPEQVKLEFRNLIGALQRQTPFSEICYRLGRLSSLATEINAPLRALPQHLQPPLNAFMVEKMEDFPLVVSHFGERGLAEGELNIFLKELEERNVRRGNLLRSAAAGSSEGEWQNERSEVYGQAQLIYNEMILDTARLWLHVWETAGGRIDGSPYFDK